MWDAIQEYYTTIGNKYHVNPVIFLSVHIVATPLFIFASTWIVKKYKKKESLFLPTLIAVFIFNAANIYLIKFGINISWLIYFIFAITSIITGYFSYNKIKNKLDN